EEYSTDSVVYCTVRVQKEVLTKEGYTFSGWSELPVTMPANDVVVEGSFSVNSYLLTYMVDGEEYATEEVAYGSAITLKEAPVKEGYLFSGWSEVPETMPAKDIVVTGSFEVDGIEAILTDKLVDVYTLQGVMVKRQIPVEDLKRELPTGIYIINGKKVAVRRKG
ncbi:MAG: InlB B-repeat-containing protein, partial [Bacteroidaceae bacterium]|nr:InlB B-repeat-containing protein [Bacteroidaceae bacterium]